MNSKTEPGLLHVLVMEGNLDGVIAALERGADPNERDRSQRTPLFISAMSDDLPITSELIRRGANVNARDVNGETPLHFAAREHTPSAALALLENGAVVDAQDIHGNTPLFRAVYDSRGRGEMIKLLLSHGADKTLTNKYGVSPEQLANTISNYDVRKYLKSG